MSDGLQKAVLSAVVGALLGWSGKSLTLDGRVAAIEASQMRIEKRLDELVDAMESRQ